MAHRGLGGLGTGFAELRDLLGFLRSPAARHSNDASVAEQLNARVLAPRLPPGLALQWLGTAGFCLSYEGYHLLIDPYVTRLPIAQVFAGIPRADEAQVRRYVAQADAVLLTHTHFDHALDVATLCRAYGCPAYGSRSLCSLLGLHGLSHLARLAEPYRPMSLGPFQVTFVPSRHSKLLLGLAVPFAGEFTCDHLDRLRGWDYRCGDVYGLHIALDGWSCYHQGSAEISEDQVRHRGVDVLLTCIAGRGFSKDYVARAVHALQPAVVVAHHHDNFFLPLDGPMGFSFNVNLGGFVDEVKAVSQALEVCVFAPLQIVQGSGHAPSSPAANTGCP